MSTFWKPVKSSRVVWGRGNVHKQLGHGLYQLWARCDICCRSGEYGAFNLFERGQESATICDQCDQLDSVHRLLTSDNWVRR